LDNFVLQRSDTDGTFPTIGFGNVNALRGLCAVRASVNSSVEINNVVLQVLLVFLPCHSVNSDRCVLLQVEKGFSQTVFVHVV